MLSAMMIRYLLITLRRIPKDVQFFDITIPFPNSGNQTGCTRSLIPQVGVGLFYLSFSLFFAKSRW